MFMAWYSGRSVNDAICSSPTDLARTLFVEVLSGLRENTNSANRH